MSQYKHIWVQAKLRRKNSSNILQCCVKTAPKLSIGAEYYFSSRKTQSLITAVSLYPLIPHTISSVGLSPLECVYTSPCWQFSAFPPVPRSLSELSYRLSPCKLWNAPCNLDYTWCHQTGESGKRDEVRTSAATRSFNSKHKRTSRAPRKEEMKTQCSV